MPRRHAREVILVQWTINESLWRDFVNARQALDRRHPNGFVTWVPPKEFPVSGIDVVLREDALFVGDVCVRGLLRYYGVSVHESRLEVFMPSEEGESCVYVLPIARPARAEVTRVVERFIAADREAARRIEEEEARPTIFKRLLKWLKARGVTGWIETHFVLVLLAFFFGVIPLLVFCLYLLQLAFHRD